MEKAKEKKGDENGYRQEKMEDRKKRNERGRETVTKSFAHKSSHILNWEHLNRCI